MFSFIPNEYFLLAFGFLLLIKGGDWFVDAASNIAKRFHLPELLIGATVVSIGTTLPEVMTSAMGAAAGSGAVAYGKKKQQKMLCMARIILRAWGLPTSDLLTETILRRLSIC